MDRAVNNPRLEAIVGVAKGYRGRHIAAAIMKVPEAMISMVLYMVEKAGA
jgi:hypothetical protein